MFVKSSKKAAIIGLYTTFSVLGAASTAHSSSDIKETIPVTVKLNGVQTGNGPLYISVQTREQYQGIKGFGAVLEQAVSSEMSTVINIDKSGDYAVSVWHDIDNDGVFSMTDDYQIFDGWGASGNVSNAERPTFDDVRIFINDTGGSVDVDMIYPK